MSNFLGTARGQKVFLRKILIMLDFKVKEGKQDLPLCVFIHGVGMDKSIWIEPDKTQVLAGTANISKLLSRDFRKGQLQTLWHDLIERQYPALCWSQKRPAGPIQSAIDELDLLIGKYAELSTRGILFIGHSRGGLVARKFLEGTNHKIFGIITIASPHKGSNLSKWARSLSRLTGPFNSLLDNPPKGSKKEIFKKTANFLESKAVSELLPDSPLIKSLADYENILAVSTAGSNPSSFSCYLMQHLHFLLPDELLKNRGDGLVRLESAKMSFAKKHYVYPLNHLEILFDKGVRNDLIYEIEYKNV